MKKRIFIAIHYLEIGGAEISLIGLLNAINYSKYEVDLFVYSHQGELMKLIPKEVNLLPEIPKYSYIEKPIKFVIKKGFWNIAIGRLWAKVQAWSLAHKKNFNKPNNSVYHYIMENIIHDLPMINPEVEYDLAISFLHPFHIVKDKVRAKKKVGWIHTDFSLFDTDIESELKIWNSMDYIVSISDAITRSFLSVYPSLQSKVRIIENILPVTYINKQVNAFSFQYPTQDGINFLSVGRFSYQKNFDNIPEICSLIRKRGINVYWYLIGFGGDEPLIREKIKKFQMEEYVIILGKKENPYPYIKACDLYIQPSRYEGKSIVVREAQFLNKPVVITRFPSSDSQLTDGYDGFIVPLDNWGCASGIVDILQHPELINAVKRNTATRDYTLSSEIQKLYDLI
ncbi:glycosyltransferase [Phocaeicola coprocola]